MSNMIKLRCNFCNKEFFILPYRKTIAKFCSRKCHYQWSSLNTKGDKAPRWKGGKIKHSNGYFLIKKWGHPFTNKNGYVPEHRLILEKKLGYYINPKQFDVHHIDGNKTNNKLENLQLVTHLEHHRIEHNWKLINGIWWKPCNFCNRFLEVEKNFYRRNGKTSQDPHVSKCIDCHHRI